MSDGHRAGKVRRACWTFRQENIQEVKLLFWDPREEKRVIGYLSTDTGRGLGCALAFSVCSDVLSIT